MRSPTYRYLLTGTAAAVFCLLTSQTSAEERGDMKAISSFSNNELPKALFIVPWKDAESPLIPERPLNSLLNDTLQPVDMDVFRRYLQYLDKINRFTSKTREKVHANPE
jgi:hypothetical protein